MDEKQTGFVITHAGLLTIMFGFAIHGNDRLMVWASKLPGRARQAYPTRA